MKALQHAAGLVAVIAVILVLGVTAIDIASFNNSSYFLRSFLYNETVLSNSFVAGFVIVFPL